MMRGITAAVCIGLATLTAAPAHADADTPMERNYIAALDMEGIHYTSEDAVITAGYTICRAFHSGETIGQIVNEGMQGSGLPSSTVSYIVGAAVAAFCPDVHPFETGQKRSLH